jgi:hypothetical protein
MTESIQPQLIQHLRFHPDTLHAQEDALFHSSVQTWMKGLHFLDTAGLTLHLRDKLEMRQQLDLLPAPVRRRLEVNQADNSNRTRRLIEQFLEINLGLQQEGIRYKSLKGFLLFPLYVSRRESRVQYDFDFLVHREDLLRAQNFCNGLGYAPVHSNPRIVADHIPSLIKRSGWHWRGNFFDPEIPPGIELHYQLWEPEFERFSIKALHDALAEDHWEELYSVRIPALTPASTLLHCVLHGLRHILRGDLRLSHLYEIGHILEMTKADQSFWQLFLQKISHCPKSKQAAAIMFSLASAVFNPSLSEEVRQLISTSLTAAGGLWIQSYGRKEALQCYRRSKSSVFLHLDLVESGSSKRAVLRQKLLPRHLPLSPYGVEVPRQQLSLASLLFNRIRYLRFLITRGWFHFQSLFWFLAHWLRWKWRLRKFHPSENSCPTVNDIGL